MVQHKQRKEYGSSGRLVKCLGCPNNIALSNQINADLALLSMEDIKIPYALSKHLHNTVPSTTIGTPGKDE